MIDEEEEGDKGEGGGEEGWGKTMEEMFGELKERHGSLNKDKSKSFMLPLVSFFLFFLSQLSSFSFFLFFLDILHFLLTGFFISFTC